MSSPPQVIVQIPPPPQTILLGAPAPGVLITGSQDPTRIVEVVPGTLHNPMLGPDDLIRGGSSGVAERLPPGAVGQVVGMDPITGHLGYLDPLAGSGDLHYRHVQSTPATVWTIVHNLGKTPSITTVDSAGTLVLGDVTYLSLSSASVEFSVPFGGEAYCN